MDHHIGGKSIQNSYHHYPGQQYDPNMGSAAPYSPTSYTATDSMEHQQARNVDPNAYSNVTYSNVIFVPDTGQPDGENGIIDSSQSYILPPDARLFNTYIRTDVENASIQYNDPQNSIIPVEMSNSQIENYQLQAATGNYDLSTGGHLPIDGGGDSSVVDPAATNTEIIMQEVNGEFYQQIQNIYVDGDQGNSIEIVPALIGDHFPEYDNQSYYSTYEIESDFIMCPNPNDKVSNEVVYVANNETATEQHVQMYVNNHQQFDNYKNEYTVLEPMNPQIMQQHLQQQDIASGYHQTNDLSSMVSVQPTAMSLEEKEQQRLLLESTMSPLLAAVNDITSRDEQFQSYLAQNPVKDHNLNPVSQYNSYVNNSVPVSAPHSVSSTSSMPLVDQQPNYVPAMHAGAGYKNTLKITNINTASNEYVDINDMDFIENRSQMTYVEGGENLLLRRSQRKPPKKNEELLVTDKRVPSRAWATLPTTYLYIGKPADGETEFTVFSKKDIPLRTKFGPLEGDLRPCSNVEKDQLKMDTDQKCPLLFLADTHIVDVSNEYTSNWMRFVRLATKFSDQNLQLHESDNKLFFQSCQIIGPKHEFKVGYSPEYAARYGLTILEPDEREKVALYEKNHPWPCFECEKKFETYEALQMHLNDHDKTVGNGLQKNGQKRRRKITRRHRLTTRKISGPTVRYACCFCSEVFSKYSNLKRHNEFVHSYVDGDATKLNSSVLVNSNRQNANKNVRCEICRRSFGSAERLEKHNLMHKSPMDPKLVQCTYCPERLLTPSALAMHVKSHLYKNRLFSCLFCSQRFRLASEVISHVQIHMENGAFTCQYCNKIFKKYVLIRKHIRCYHSSVKHTCAECGKECTSKTKLKHHMLKHSDVREFLCADCGKQFKRKDKLREHILAIHSKKDKTVDDEPKVTAEKSIVQPNAAEKKISDDYHRYFYKCHDCLLGFKRRGMLVNHMAKRHPNVSVDTVPELNLPILKVQRYYYCQYCDKVYKSSGKRKAHILKNHPGAELPQSFRRQSNNGNMLGTTNGSFSETVGNVTTDPFRCQWCHKQYASKARLLQHQRKEHRDQLNEIDQTNCAEQQVEPNMPSANVPPPPQHQPILPQHSQAFTGFESENKLLKLSSAALEASLKDDFHFFEETASLPSSIPLNGSSNSSALPKVDVNFKVVNADFAEPSQSSNGELQRLPQLFEEIDYIDVKPVVMSTESNDCYATKKINYEFSSQDSSRI